MNRLRIGTALLLAGFLAACGGGSGGGSADTATLTGTLGSGAARTAARTLAATTGEYYVEAVDESGTVQDQAQGLHAGDTFELHVPAGHTYVIVVGDGMGPLGGAVYDPAEGRSDFEVPAGVTHLVLGTLEVDAGAREVRMGGDGDPLTPPAEMAKPDDNDGDHIPDFADDDDDNDGIPDDRDHVAGVDHSRDHDNDGVADQEDLDDDDDGAPDVEDTRPYDRDDDGVDDDRALGAAGDAAAGAQVYAENGCATCHGEDGTGGSAEDIRNTSAHDLAEVLWKGEDEGEDHDEKTEHEDDEEGEHDGGGMGMPAFPQLVPYAADLAAFLSGAPADTGGQAPPADMGSQPSPADSGAQAPGTDSGTQAPSPDTGTQTPPPDAGNQPTPTVDGRAVYDNICSTCHVLGTHDTAGFAPNLSGKGARVSGKFGGGSSHMGHTLTDAEIQAVADFLNSN